VDNNYKIPHDKHGIQACGMAKERQDDRFQACADLGYKTRPCLRCDRHYRPTCNSRFVCTKCKGINSETSIYEESVIPKQHRGAE